MAARPSFAGQMAAAAAAPEPPLAAAEADSDESARYCSTKKVKKLTRLYVNDL